jgi:ribosomal protein L31
MRRFLIILSAVVLVAFSSCKKVTEGNIITKDFNNPSSYTALEISSAFDAYVSENTDVITVTAGENVMPYVVVETENNTLKIYLKPMTIVSISELKVVLPRNENLLSVNLSGATEFHSEFGLIGEDLKVELSGASKFDCDLGASGSIDMIMSGASNVESAILADELKLEMSGASHATLIGAVSYLKLDLSGASKLMEKVIDKQYSLLCLMCEGSISGGSSAYIHCDGDISVDLSGASHLHYTGDGNTTGSSWSGGSDITHDTL